MSEVKANNIYLISRRKQRIVDIRFEKGDMPLSTTMITTVEWLETEEEWLKRCAVIKYIDK